MLPLLELVRLRCFFPKFAFYYDGLVKIISGHHDFPEF